ncbi:MAG TPA: MFS transporter [Chloroflexia bacterium]|jgi:MFS family permease
MSSETNGTQGEAASKAEAGGERITFITVLRNGNFRNLWIGQVISSIGDYFAFLALMVVVAGFSDNPSATTGAVSGLMIAVTLPRLLFGVLAGVFVDRWDRRRTMLVSDVIRSGLTLLMIPAVLSKNLLLVYMLGFALSTVGTLFMPAKGALIPKLVPQEHLLSANSLSQTSMMLANFIGPALAGITFWAVGNSNQWVAFVFDSVSYLVSAAAIMSVRVPREVSLPAPDHALGAQHSALGRVWEELKVGLKALLLNRVMATLSAVFAVTMFGVGALNVLWVVFLETGFGFKESELAWRFSVVDIAFFAGMVGASVVAGNFMSHLAPKWFIVWGLVGAGLLTTFMGYLPDYWLVVATMLGVGLFVAPVNTGTTTLTQIVVPNSQLGRVGGGIGTIVDTATLGSMSLAGVFGAMWGIPFVFLVSGVLCALGGVLAWALLPALTLKDKVEEDAPAEAPVGAPQMAPPAPQGSFREITVAE